QFERNYGECIRLQQARVTQDGSDWGDQLNLAGYQRLAGDTAGAKVTAEKARNILEQSYKEERRYTALATFTAGLSLVYALMGDKASALKLAERAIQLDSRDGTQFVILAPNFEENLAGMQMGSGENSRAIATLTHLLQTPYNSNCYGPAPVTRALLR